LYQEVDIINVMINNIKNNLNIGKLISANFQRQQAYIFKKSISILDVKREGAIEGAKFGDQSAATKFIIANLFRNACR